MNPMKRFILAGLLSMLLGSSAVHAVSSELPGSSAAGQIVHAAILGRLLTHAAGGANLIPDTHLAALAIEHGLTLCSADGDFARFLELKWMNPLREPVE